MSDSDSLDVMEEHVETEHLQSGDPETAGRKAAGHKSLSMSDHLAAARSDLRISMPGDVPLSKFIREVQRREAAEVELVAQRQVNTDIMSQLKDQIEANEHLSAALEKASTSVVGERQQKELISLQLHEVMKEQSELVHHIEEKSSKAEYSEQLLEELQLKYQESSSKLIKKHEVLVRKAREETESFRMEASVALEKVRDLEVQLAEERQQCRLQQKRTIHLEQSNAALQQQLESEKSDARTLRMQIARTAKSGDSDTDSAQATEMERTLDKVRRELRTALEAKEELAIQVERLKASIDTLQTRAEAEKTSYRLDKKTESSRHSEEFQRIEKRFVAVQKQHEEELDAARMMQSAAESSRDQALRELASMQQSSADGGRMRRALVERAEAAEQKTIALETEKTKLEAELTDARKQIGEVRGEKDERVREAERIKVQAMAAMERRKTVEEELFAAKEELLVLQGAVEKERTALRAARAMAGSRDTKTAQLQTELSERREEACRLERTMELRVEEERASGASQVRHLEAALARKQREEEERAAQLEGAREEVRELRGGLEGAVQQQARLRRELEEADAQLLDAKASLVAARSESSRLRADLPRLVDCLRAAEESNIVLESRCKVLEMEKKLLPHRSNHADADADAAWRDGAGRGGGRGGGEAGDQHRATRRLDFPRRPADPAAAPPRKEDTSSGSRLNTHHLTAMPPQLAARLHRAAPMVAPTRPTTRRRPNSTSASPVRAAPSSPSVVAELPGRPKSADGGSRDAWGSGARQRGFVMPSYAHAHGVLSARGVGTRVGAAV